LKEKGGLAFWYKAVTVHGEGDEEMQNQNKGGERGMKPSHIIKEPEEGQIEIRRR